tara:strand:- start:367 stop:627 length:261 start_codon:yes stop_codon:yes gene_type:complete
MYRTYFMLFVAMIILGLLIQGCSVKWQPVVDPRGGDNYAEITRDILECKELTKEISNICWDRMFDCNKKDEALKTCLSNRGHSVLN